VGVHRPAAAGTAVADSIESPQHGVLEEGVMDMAALVFGVQNLRSLLLADPTGATWVILTDKAGKGLANHQADVQGLAGVGAHGAAGTFQDDDMVRVVQHNVAGHGVGDRLFQISNGDVLLNHDQLRGFLQGHDLAVVGIGKGGALLTIVLWRREQDAVHPGTAPEDTAPPPPAPDA